VETSLIFGSQVEKNNENTMKPMGHHTEERSSRLAEIDEIWARNTLPSPVQQQQRPQQL